MLAIYTLSDLFQNIRLIFLVDFEEVFINLFWSKIFVSVFVVVGTLLEKLSKYCDYFLRLSGFPNLSDKVFLITF